MNHKINCDVINDLMPSYLDGICSEASKKLVEEHLSECRACRSLIDSMQKTQIVSEKTVLKELNYMKKVREHFVKKNIAGLFVLALVTLGGFIMMLTSSSIVSETVYRFCLPLLAVYSYFILSDYGKRKENRKWKTGLLVVNLAFLLYNAGLAAWILKLCHTLQNPLGMTDRQVGPFFAWQLIGIAAIQTILFLTDMFLCAKNEERYHPSLMAALTNIFLAQNILTLLHHMEEPNAFSSHLGYSFGILLFEGIFAGIILALIGPFRASEPDTAGHSR